MCGAGGFIGGRLVKRLKAEGFWVLGVDLKYPEFCASAADEFLQGDLRDPRLCEQPAAICSAEDMRQGWWIRSSGTWASSGTQRRMKIPAGS